MWRPPANHRPLSNSTPPRPSPPPWTVPAQKDNLCTNVAVFDPRGRILLVQRARYDYWMPQKWEIPGGSAERSDESILHGAARELWEETQLVATGVRRVIAENQGPDGGYAFRDEIRGVRFCRFAFEVEGESCEGVILDPDEYQAYLWVGEDEVRDEKVGEREIPITDGSMRSLILEAIRLKGAGEGWGSVDG
ncbi:NUDIX hydrolase domain-like protein [Lasiosphaeria ovina]|uniref:NUDIX hydrolase domain-like protein n=1 Tax=Lasiosphaeria ovina TaxID=92902 RepID=A0AAE0N9D6_9PEZI|nr:NUDIX hydrolase domain-like protein [Lasiosphaeria ovina]